MELLKMGGNLPFGTTVNVPAAGGDVESCSWENIDGETDGCEEGEFGIGGSCYKLVMQAVDAYTAER